MELFNVFGIWITIGVAGFLGSRFIARERTIYGNAPMIRSQIKMGLPSEHASG